MNIQTAADVVNEIASNNNTMIALQKKIGKRSNIGAFVVNRERFKDYNFSEDNDKYNRVIGLDYFSY